MAVKVMVAPAIVSGQLSKPATRQGHARPKAAPRPKRRKSAVYDAEGNEVLITLICLKCQKIRPLSQFGLRKMADGSIRNQPWCRTCRSATSARAEEGIDGEERTTEESSKQGESPDSAPSPTPSATSATPEAGPERRRTGAVAAEVAAALSAGRG